MTRGRRSDDVHGRVGRVSVGERGRIRVHQVREVRRHGCSSARITEFGAFGDRDGDGARAYGCHPLYLRLRGKVRFQLAPRVAHEDTVVREEALGSRHHLPIETGKELALDRVETLARQVLAKGSEGDLRELEPLGSRVRWLVVGLCVTGHTSVSLPRTRGCRERTYLVSDHERSDREAFAHEVPHIVRGQSDIREVDDRGEDGARVEEAANDVLDDAAHEEVGLQLKRSLEPRSDHHTRYRGYEYVDEELWKAGREPPAQCG